jgi:hypothetical protein
VLAAAGHEEAIHKGYGARDAANVSLVDSVIVRHVQGEAPVGGTVPAGVDVRRESGS